MAKNNVLMISGWLYGLSAGNPFLITKQYYAWSNIANPTANIFNYGYDKLNRLETAATTAGISMSEALTYDIMGNIKSLNRDGAGAKVYNYYNSGNSNRLQSVSGLTTQNYEYDANGNATKDGLSGISLTYNYLNLPATAVRTTGTAVTLSYTYDATGNKLAKNSSSMVRNYINGIEYKPDGTTIDIIHTEEGIARNSGGTYSYEYNLSDHLGNIRSTFYKNPITNQLEVLQQDNYYAFGLRKEPVVKAGTNKYLYNGKELQEELGAYDYGARFYDPVIGRWNVVDPLAEKMRRYSPYNYAFDNPIRFVDPDGMIPKDIIILGTKEYRLQVFKHLQSLTNQKLTMKNDGHLTIGTPTVRNKPVGTDLVRDLIKSEHKTVIKNTEGTGNMTTFASTEKASGKVSGGSPSTINYNPVDPGTGIVNADGTTGRPAQVGLAHELGHARDGINGKVNSVDYDNPTSVQQGTVIVNDPDNGERRYMTKDEYNIRKNVDNPIRREQGAKARAMPQIVP